MRRTVVIWTSLAALALPASALAVHLGAGDGTVVVQNGTAPRGTPVVTLVIKGAAIGQIDSGRIVIKDLVANDAYAAEVNGYAWHTSNADEGTETYGGVGPNFRFRAVGGTYKITIYGQGIDLVASGKGNVVLVGSPDSTSDGRYSLNGQPFTSLPATPTKTIQLLNPTSATG